MTALIGARLRATTHAELRERERERVGAEAVLVGVELHRTEPTRVAQEHAAAVGEAQAEPVPRGDVAIARVDERVARGFAVDDHPPAHPEVQREHPSPFGTEPTSSRRG